MFKQGQCQYLRNCAPILPNPTLTLICTDTDIDQSNEQRDIQKKVDLLFQDPSWRERRAKQFTKITTAAGTTRNKTFQPTFWTKTRCNPNMKLKSMNNYYDNQSDIIFFFSCSFYGAWMLKTELHCLTCSWHFHQQMKDDCRRENELIKWLLSQE